jgi:hypothetical protein
MRSGVAAVQMDTIRYEATVQGVLKVCLRVRSPTRDSRRYSKQCEEGSSHDSSSSTDRTLLIVQEKKNNRIILKFCNAAASQPWR